MQVRLTALRVLGGEHWQIAQVLVQQASVIGLQIKATGTKVTAGGRESYLSVRQQTLGRFITRLTRIRILSHVGTLPPRRQL